MCGIVGTFRFDNKEIDTDLLKEQVQLLNHRGPDANGIWCRDQVGLGHLRLSILDLSDNGKQPMVSPDGNFTLVFNGEIYNYRELKKSFTPPFPYSGTSDTEVLLNGLIHEGESFINKLEGMFAFAFYNHRDGTLLIARDAFGIKPVYYYKDQDHIVFASEIKAILKDPAVKVEKNEEALKEYFLLGYSLDPHTAFKNIYRLPPASIMHIDGKGIKIRKYWSIYDLLHPDKVNGRKEWMEVFDESLRLHSISDVPIGSFLSGGMDSNMMLYSLKKQGLLEKSFTAYNAGKEGNGSGSIYWERQVAVQAANHFGVDLVKIESNEDAFMSFDKVLDIVEEPICNPSNYLIDQICSEAGRRKQKVLLSGHGGDEIFAGYRRHLVARYLGIIRKFGIGELLRMLSKGDNNLLYRIAHAGSVSNKHPLLSLIAIGLSLTAKKKSISDWITSEDIERIGNKLYTHLDPAYNLSYLKQMMILEFETYLACQNLINMDKFSMRHSIEVRVPFLYRPLVQVGLNMKDSELINGFETKSSFRKAGSEILPEFITNKPKSGFSPVQAKLIQSGEIKSVVLSDTLQQRGFFNKTRIEERFYGNEPVSETQALQLMNIATIEKWLIKHKL